MSNIKQHLYDLQAEEEALWESYLDFCQENQDTFQQLPYNIQVEIKENYGK